MRVITVLLSAVLMWSAAMFVQATPQAAAASSGEIDGMEKVLLSAKLADMGRVQRDPLLLLAAARILSSVDATSATLSAEITGASDTSASPLAAPTAKSLYDEARAMAAGDANLTALIERSQSDISSRGAGGGPKVHQQRIARGARATFRADFRGREPAQVVIVGSHTANLDLVILDANNRVVCVSRTPYDYEVCRWYPPANASFWLAVENRGDQSSVFSIYTN